LSSQPRKIKAERHLELFWEGPFGLADGVLSRHPLGPEPQRHPKPGLYIAVSDLPLRGSRVLLYVGKSARSLSNRLKEHRWFQWEWNLEVYIAQFAETDLSLLDDAECLLIRAHLPPANTQHIARTRRISQPLRIWNIGRFWGLYPEISSRHEWNR
jgi:hypothetical protein